MNLKDFSLADVNTGKHDFTLTVSELMDGTKLVLRVGVIKGAAEGPTLTVVAAQHGNEWNGTYICHKIFRSVDYKDLKGTLVLLPTANPIAFHQGTRVNIMDHIDMNRAWGLTHRRKPTEHLAEKIFRVFIAGSDYVVDLHSGGPGEYLPCVASINREWEDLLLAFNLDCSMMHKAHGKISSAKGSVSLAHACMKNDIPCFLVEIGHGRSIDRKACGKFVDGFINFSRKVGSLSGKSTINPNSTIYNNKATVAAEKSGFLNAGVRLGATLEKDDLIACVTPLFSDDVVEFRAPTAGLLIYLRKSELVSEGDSIAHLAF